MYNNVRETSMFRKGILGIRLIPFKEKPVYTIQKWKIYDAGRVEVLPPEDRVRNLNFQIERGHTERILIRIFLSSDKLTIERTKYYFILDHTDTELSWLLTLTLLKRLPYSISPDHELISFGL